MSIMVEEDGGCSHDAFVGGMEVNFNGYALD